MENILVYLAGVMTIPLMKAALWILYIFKFALKDTYQVLRYGELKEGCRWWNWLHIIPRVFIKSLIDTATSVGQRVS